MWKMRIKMVSHVGKFAVAQILMILEISTQKVSLSCYTVVYSVGFCLLFVSKVCLIISQYGYCRTNC